MTVTQAAAATGISHHTLRRALRGEVVRWPTYDAIAAYLSAYPVTLGGEAADLLARDE